jgi:outer membrane protein OmpA-like peptidoglycan-associated protein
MRRRSLIAIAAATAIAFAAGPARAKDETFFVFFQLWSALIDPAGEDVIKAAATVAKAHPNALIDVRGYASTDGSRQANLFISLARAQLVTDGLVKHGIAAARIKRIGEGEVEFVDDPQANRRVDIVIRVP